MKRTFSTLILASVLAIFTAQNVSAQYAKTFSIEKSPIPMEDLVPGNTVKLGTWGEEGKRKPIEWLVLRENDDGSFMLISKKILDFSAFDTSGRKTEWQDSSLIGWLNGFFYSSGVFKKRKNVHI